MPDGNRPPRRATAAFLALVAGCAVLIAGTAALTGERIEENRAQRFQRTLTELTGSPALAADLRWESDVAVLSNDHALLRGAVAGYGGDIQWLASVSLGPPVMLDRLRITAHQETPGIADFLDTPGRGWLASLYGRTAESLQAVDAVSGATITSRALRRDLATALGHQRLDAAAGEDPL